MFSTIYNEVFKNYVTPPRGGAKPGVPRKKFYTEKCVTQGGGSKMAQKASCNNKMALNSRLVISENVPIFNTILN